MYFSTATILIRILKNLTLISLHHTFKLNFAVLCSMFQKLFLPRNATHLQFNFESQRKIQTLFAVGRTGMSWIVDEFPALKVWLKNTLKVSKLVEIYFQLIANTQLLRDIYWIWSNKQKSSTLKRFKQRKENRLKWSKI